MCPIKFNYFADGANGCGTRAGGGGDDDGSGGLSHLEFGAGGATTKLYICISVYSQCFAQGCS